ncbi:MAG: RidA family protein, partial [Tepidiformaceae bacterium]
MSRQNISSNGPWEAAVGYSRAVRVGNQIFVAGTTSTNADGSVYGVGDPAAQVRRSFETIAAALAEAGATLSDVVRTRMFVTDISRWEEYGRAHGEVFAGILPASTMVEVAALISP